MARMVYQLSPQTRKVLTNHVKDIAIEFDCDPSHMYQILSDVEPDPFAKFRRLFKAAVRAEAPFELWMDELSGIIARYTKAPPKRSATECLIEHIQAGSELATKMVESFADGRIDDIEAAKLQAALRDAQAALDHTMLLVQYRGEILPTPIREAARARR